MLPRNIERILDIDAAHSGALALRESMKLKALVDGLLRCPLPNWSYMGLNFFHNFNSEPERLFTIKKPFP